MGWRSIFMVLGVASAWASPGTGQEAAPVPVRDALVDIDGDRVPDRLGDTVTVEGIVTSAPIVVGWSAALANFQDRTGGVLLFTRDTTLLAPLSAGDSIRVRGRLDQYRGTEQIIVDGYEHLGRTAVPEPRDVLVRELEGERFAGRLVRSEGTLHVTTTENGRLGVRLRDRTGSIPLHVSALLLSDPDFVRRLRRGGTASVVGVAGQQTDSDPPLDGYRLIPRRQGDFDFAAIPRYDLLAMGAALALILGTIIALVLWRRSAARRAEELEELAAELSRSREEIGIREARYRSLVENARDTVAILDEQGTVLYHGPSVTRMLGWLPEELEGRSAFEHVHPQDLPRLEPVFRNLAQEPGGHREVDLRFRARDGTWHDLEVLGTNRLHDPAVRGIVCNIRDVTHHRALEHRLRQADRLETVGRLAGGIAHDFNNILTAIRGHADMALEEMPKGSPGRPEIVEVARNTDRAAAVTRHLLAFTRQQVRETQVVSASALIRGMIPTLRRLIGAAIEISFELPDRGDIIEVDPTQIEQVLLNLVINARDATPDGGRVCVMVAEDEITQARAAQYPYLVRSGQYLRISVVDSGTGMDEAVLNHVFEPFFTTKKPGEGTGLGLASVYGIVKQSSGYIWVDSHTGSGTRFDIFLPRLEGGKVEEAPPAAEQDCGAAGRPGAGERILLVEDEDAVRRLSARVLRKHGYEVVEASRGDEALGLLEENPDVHLLLTDVVMPGMSGIQLAESITNRLPDLPVLLVSGYTANELVVRAGASGPSLLEKPFTPQQLLDQVAECLRATRRVAANQGATADSSS